MNLSPIKSSSNPRTSRRPTIQAKQKALSSSSFETNSTAVSSSPSLTCTYSCYGSNFSRTPQHHATQMRRGAIVFHPFVPQQVPMHSSPPSSSSSTSSNTRSRKYKRRFATCCSYPETIQAARIVAKLVQEIHSSSLEEVDVPPRNAVIFDRSGRLVPEHDINDHLLKRWFLYYIEMYRLTRSKTHRSIVVNSFLEELKSDNFSFYQIKGSSSSEVEKYVKLDDEILAHRIRKEIGRIQLD